MVFRRVNNRRFQTGDASSIKTWSSSNNKSLTTRRRRSLCLVGLLVCFVILVCLVLLVLQRTNGFGIIDTGNSYYSYSLGVEEEWWEPKPLLLSSSSSSAAAASSLSSTYKCQPLDPRIEQDFVGFPQNLTYGKYVAEKGRPFLTHDFWATIVDNRRTFLLRSFEAGFPLEDRLQAWIRSRPHPITFIINNNLDQSWPNEDGLLNKTSYQVILNETNVHAVYASNARYLKDYPKLQPMPIGLKWAYKSTLLFGEPKDERAQNYRKYGASSPAQSESLFFSRRRKSTVFWRPMQARSNAATTKYVRDTPALQAPRASIPPIVKETAKNSMVFSPAHMPQEDFFGELKKHRFVISPPGNGLDTHATWEALLCGCIPIVPRSDLDRVFDDLPVWLVDSWEEVTDATVKEKEAYFLANHKKWNWEKLYQPYWEKRIHEDLKQADAIRKKGRKKKKLNAADRNHIRDVYTKLQAIVERCDADLFRERVPDRETVAWLSHATAVFQEIAKGQQWIRTGTALRHDEMLLASCCFLFKHPVPVVHVFEDNNAFFASIVALILARKGTFLVPEFAQTIELAVGNIFCCSMMRFDNPWAPEKTFKKLEAEGILEHYMLCVAIKQPHEDTETLKNVTLKHLLTCTAFIKKRFTVGSPCGDSLRAIMDGHMEVCPRALPYLQSLLKLSSSLENENAWTKCNDVCRYCHKADLKSKLLLCSRCMQYSYCSRDCQKADWKRHKVMCFPGKKKRAIKNAEVTDQLITEYAQRHYVDIMVRLVRECDKVPGLQMKDMVLELDFNPDETGNVPILQDTPQFKVFTNSRYLETEVEEGGIINSKEETEGFAAQLNDRSNSDLLCYILFSQRTKGCSLFNIFDPITKQNMYTEETLVAFRSTVHANDYGRLAHIFHEQDRWKYFAEKIELLQRNGV